MGLELSQGAHQGHGAEAWTRRGSFLEEKPEDELRFPSPEAEQAPLQLHVASPAAKQKPAVLARPPREQALCTPCCGVRAAFQKPLLERWKRRGRRDGAFGGVVRHHDLVSRYQPDLV